MPLANEAILAGIRNNDSRVLEALYHDAYPPVARHVRAQGGSERDARDVFQEGILIVYRKLRTDELTLTTDFAGYLFGVCRLVWKGQLRKKRREPVTTAPEASYPSELPRYADRLLEQRKRRLFLRQLAKLGEECRAVLQAFFDGDSLRVIAARMGYTEQYAKRKKYRCKNQLVKLVQADPEYLHLKSDDHDPA